MAQLTVQALWAKIWNLSSFIPQVSTLQYAPQFLLSEAMRGEGAILANINKEPL